MHIQAEGQRTLEVVPEVYRQGDELRNSSPCIAQGMTPTAEWRQPCRNASNTRASRRAQMV
jgi:hypothetical protein